MTANDIILALQGHTPLSRCPVWVQRAALLYRPNKFNRTYDTTAARFYTEVTVRPPATKIARRSGQPYQTLKRRRLDLVALVQPNYRAYQPLVIGVEIKVAEHDLRADQKIAEYLPYVHMFYLAVPASLQNAARQKLNEIASVAGIGLLVVGIDLTVDELQPAQLTQPSNRHLQEIYAELLIKPFREGRNNG